MTYPNEALTAACELLMGDFGLTLEQIRNVAADIPGECAAMTDNRAEAAWLDHQQALMETGGTDNSTYRKAVTDAGRGHLLGGQ